MNAPDGAAAAAAEAFRASAQAFNDTAMLLFEAARQAATQADPAERARQFSAALQGVQPQISALWAAGPWGAANWAGPAWQAPGAAGSAIGAAPASPAAMGPTREQQLALQRLQQLTMQYVQQQAALSTRWGEVLQRALQQLGERIASGWAPGAPPPEPRALYDAWIECAEANFSAAAHSPEWIDAQTALANTGAQLRLEQRALLESAARQLDLPTRAELDAVHRQLRALQAELRAARAPQPAPRPARARKPTRR